MKKTLLPIALLLLSAPSLFPTAPLSPVWFEGESFCDAIPGGKSKPEYRQSASSGSTLPGSILVNRGDRFLLPLNLPADIPRARWIVRYSRLHWKEGMAPAAVGVHVQNGSETLSGRIIFDHTGGWGSSPKDWSIAEMHLGNLKKGPSSIALTAEGEQSNVMIDGFWIAPEDFSVSREELATLHQIRITSEGYLGIRPDVQTAEQQLLAGFSIAGRSLQPQATKLSLDLLAGDGTVALSLLKEKPFRTGPKPEALSVDARRIAGLPDGDYTLRFSFEGGPLSLPVPLFGRRFAEAEKEAAAITAFLKGFSDGGSPRRANAATDLRHAAEFLTTTLDFLRLRAGTRGQCANLD